MLIKFVAISFALALFAAFTVLLFFLALTWPHEPPSDADVLAKFNRQRAGFERLVDLLEQHDVWGLVESRPPPPEPNLQPIATLMSELGISHLRRETGEQTTLIYASSYFAGHGWAKLIVHNPVNSGYMEWEPVADLDAAYAANDWRQPLTAERRIGDRWALRVDYSP
jgi:hypothetical protein